MLKKKQQKNKHNIHLIYKDISSKQLLIDISLDNLDVGLFSYTVLFSFDR